MTVENNNILIAAIEKDIIKYFLGFPFLKNLPTNIKDINSIKTLAPIDLLYIEFAKSVFPTISIK